MSLQNEKLLLSLSFQNQKPVEDKPYFIYIISGANHLIGMRRNGETIGVRQSLEYISQVATRSEILALSRRVIVHAMDPYEAK